MLLKVCRKTIAWHSKIAQNAYIALVHACLCMYVLYTLSRHKGRRKHKFMRLWTKFKLRQFISISIVLQAQQDVLIRTNTKLDLYMQCINTCVQILSPVLFNIHHTGTAGCSLRIHSKARKFIQHMRSKCANCSWMLMASRSLGRKQNLDGGYVVDIVVTNWHWKVSGLQIVSSQAS